MKLVIAYHEKLGALVETQISETVCSRIEINHCGDERFRISAYSEDRTYGFEVDLTVNEIFIMRDNDDFWSKIRELE